MIDFIFSIAILIMSIVIHEVSHGVTANLLGDPTAKYEGRLTLNPLKHLDPFGSVLLPVVTYMIGGFIFGWAKPVPYNPYNLKNQRWGPALVGGAGPASNILVALVFALVLRAVSVSAPASLVAILTTIVFINILLAVFNLVPIPPLDGSKVLFALLPERFSNFQFFLEQYGFMILLLFIFVFWRYLIPLVFLLFRVFVGA
ncbi:MAG: site-2 protease family protein [bacterium]|nr:site-2 protease family protein [bacterium]